MLSMGFQAISSIPNWWCNISQPSTAKKNIKTSMATWRTLDPENDPCEIWDGPDGPKSHLGDVRMAEHLLIVLGPAVPAHG